MSISLALDDLIVVKDVDTTVAIREMADQVTGYNGDNYGSIYNETLKQMMVTPKSILHNVGNEAIVYKWYRAVVKHSDYVLAHPEKFIDLLLDASGEPEPVRVRYAGIETRWTRGRLTWLKISDESIVKLLDSVLPRLADADDSGTYLWSLPKVDEDAPLSVQAYSRAKLRNVDSIFYHSPRIWATMHGTEGRVIAFRGTRAKSTASEDLRAISTLATSLGKHDSLKRMFKQEANTLRSLLAIEQASAATKQSIRVPKTQTFEQFWRQLKSGKRQLTMNLEVTTKMWGAIPLPANGTGSWRSWGIEVETMHAERTSRPLGWHEVHDGSLESEVNDCDCGCVYCDDDDHCHDSECTNGSACAEFVSPILNHFHSAGLKKLCEEIGMDGHNTSPGVHVHVDASDVTVSDVRRLLFAYGAISPLLEPIYQRQVRDYCKDLPLDQVAHWARYTKQYIPTTIAAQVIYDIGSGDRYQDVNLCALTKHGTIEFRAMGPVYDYEYLVRWAWFCRQMVAVSKVDLPQRVWSACSSLADVIQLLIKHGDENNPGHDLTLSTLIEQ